MNNNDPLISYASLMLDQLTILFAWHIRDLTRQKQQRQSNLFIRSMVIPIFAENLDQRKTQCLPPVDNKSTAHCRYSIYFQGRSIGRSLVLWLQRCVSVVKFSSAVREERKNEWEQESTGLFWQGHNSVASTPVTVKQNSFSPSTICRVFSLSRYHSSFL